MAVYISSGRRRWNSKPIGRTVGESEIFEEIFSRGCMVDGRMVLQLALMSPRFGLVFVKIRRVSLLALRLVVLWTWISIFLGSGVVLSA